MFNINISKHWLTLLLLICVIYVICVSWKRDTFATRIDGINQELVKYLGD